MELWKAKGFQRQMTLWQYKNKISGLFELQSCKHKIYLPTCCYKLAPRWNMSRSFPRILQ